MRSSKRELAVCFQSCSKTFSSTGGIETHGCFLCFAQGQYRSQWGPTEAWLLFVDGRHEGHGPYCLAHCRSCPIPGQPFTSSPSIRGVGRIVLQSSSSRKMSRRVCLHDLTDARILPCLHSFCRSCLDHLAVTTGPDNQLRCLSCRRCTRVKVIRVEVSQNVVHARTTGWMTSARPGKLWDFGLQPRRSNPRSRNLFWALGVKSTWFLNFGGQAKCKLVLVVDSWPSLVVFGVVIPLWVKKHE